MMQRDFFDDDLVELRAQYQHLTAQVMPAMAQARRGPNAWPVTEDHCFQRIVLDTVCGGVWYDHIPRPALRNMTREQLSAAVSLSTAIVEGRADLASLNQRSLHLRVAYRCNT